MSTCNFTTTINGTDNIGSSRTRINTNFSNLDTAACSLSSAVVSLSAQIKSGALKGNPGTNGTSFFAPVGTIALFGGNTAPDSTWLLCNGTRYTVGTTYSTLQSVIQDYYKPSNVPADAGYVWVPNLTGGKIAIGASAQISLGTQSVLAFPAGSTNVLSFLSLNYFIKAQ